ncbi:hypothetical protein [Microvirga aerophila]|uniref:Uncharacterized protein n=1 Tax=Microvirga aerophila TaxID=670291 RepID=A0A512BPZ4_9HYPH|nr:hypothetical protein [Microvirga aerophila]GEO14014.1 hypothetical protein MAE02_17100 [Microvirga aerophila]
MTRPLRLALIMLLTGAGVVFAAPVVTNAGKGHVSKVVAPARQANPGGFVLHVDQKTGCVWRVSSETGKRNLDPLPCKRPKSKLAQAERPVTAP